MKNGYRIVDVDAHLQEPMDIWERYVEPEYSERAPKVIGHMGRLMFTYGPCEPFPEGMPQFWPDSTVADIPERFGEAYEAWWALEPRLKHMDQEGIDVTVCFMSNGRVAVWPTIEDPKLQAALCRAWNNWATDYCSESGGRVKFNAQISLLDVDEAVAEVRRIASRPEVGGVVLPDIGVGRMWDQGEFDPLWDLLSDEGLAACFHGGGSQRRWLSPWKRGNVAAVAHCIAFPLDCMLAMGTFIFGGILERFPELRVGFMEGNAGWLPWWLERMDDHGAGRQARFMLGKDSLPKKPSEYFERQCFVAADADEGTLQYTSEVLGGRNILFNTDYPHPDSGFPGTVDEFLEQPLAEEVKKRILWDNAIELYGNRVAGVAAPA